MPYNGIDISSWQADLQPAKLFTTDFIIVKATGGTSYSNPYFTKHASQTLAADKLLGCYHFARESGCAGTAKAEAAHFSRVVKPYIGKAVLALDWETDALSCGVSWAKAWLDEVHRLTGIRPLIYMSKSTCNSYDWASVHLGGYELWAAQYPNYDRTGYKKNPWTDSNPFGPWKSPTIFQYSSVGRVSGYADDLDLNLFHGSVSDWKKLAGNASQSREYIDVADVAATIHADMCNDAANGYSWDPRWGEDGQGVKKLTIGGRTYQYDRGSFDCASSVITSCNEALRYTAYKDVLRDATYTGNMRSVFSASGLFDVWRTATTIAQRGDVYLNDANHTAMCQSPEPDMLSEFSINETGGTHGGKVGDQTGKESWIHEFYEYPWNVTLHWKDTLLPVINSTSGANKEAKVQKLTVDGVMGKLTISELQRQLKVPVTGKMDKATVKALQKALNAGRLK